MAADDVSLPDLEVIAQFSLAVRAATAPRAQVVAALEADLRALTGSAGPRSSAPDAAPARRARPRPGSATVPPAAEAAPDEAPARAPAKRAAKATTRAPRRAAGRGDGAPSA